VVIIGLSALVWGGTNSAHERCLAHRFGVNSPVGTSACAVEH
jgi:hypothetical protein